MGGSLWVEMWTALVFLYFRVGIEGQKGRGLEYVFFQDQVFTFCLISLVLFTFNPSLGAPLLPIDVDVTKAP